MILHVLAQSRDEMESLFKEQLRQGGGDVPTICKQLASQSLHHSGNGRPIIHIARRQTTGQQITTIIDRQVQLEAVKPAHTGLAASCIESLDAMLPDAFGITDDQRSRVNEADARTRSIATLS